MNIDRHNYEEFFFLYVDNELSAIERNAVEAFVQQNPDLKKELQMLRQSVLTQEHIIFNEKNTLKKTSGNLQEKLLLYLDKELNAVESLEIEKLMLTDKAVAAELSILSQLKVVPDTNIIFTDKSSLYRKDNGRVVTFPWKRIAAAAVLIGFGTWGAISFYTKNDNSNVIANSSETDKPSINKPANQLAEDKKLMDNNTVTIASTSTPDPISSQGQHKNNPTQISIDQNDQPTKEQAGDLTSSGSGNNKKANLIATSKGDEKKYFSGK